MSQPPLQPDSLHAPVPVPVSEASGVTLIAGQAAPPTLPSPDPSSNQAELEIEIALVPASAAADGALVSRLVTVINDAFNLADRDLWKPPAPLRTDAAEVRECIKGSHLFWAWKPSPLPSSSRLCTSPDGTVAATTTTSASTTTTTGPACPPSLENLVGCITVVFRQDPGDSSPVPILGMLACDAPYLGAGVGRKLIRFGEDEARRRGATKARIELLVPCVGTHKSKSRLAAWYTRSGYAHARTDRVEDHLPRLIPFMLGPMELHIFDKAL